MNWKKKKKKKRKEEITHTRSVEKTSSKMYDERVDREGHKVNELFGKFILIISNYYSTYKINEILSAFHWYLILTIFCLLLTFLENKWHYYKGLSLIYNFTKQQEAEKRK
jgi:hypothetical protein